MLLDAASCTPIDELSRREWLETDGLGSYAMGTVSGVNTRRYHGLLAAEGAPGAGRRVLCAQLQETLCSGGQRHDFSTHQFIDTIHPQGYRYLTAFDLAPWPTWTYRLGEVVLRKQLLMIHDSAATMVVYDVLAAPGPVALELRPLVAARDYHSVAFENWSFRRQVGASGDSLELTPYDAGSHLEFRFPGGHFQGDGFWFYNFLYTAERDRGLEHREDLFSPGLINYALHEDEQAALFIHTGKLPDQDARLLLDDEAQRRQMPSTGSPLVGRLTRAAGQFLVRRQGKPGVIAGYPWFDIWRRDTMIALPGLTIADRRLNLARELLGAAAEDLLVELAEPPKEAIGVDLGLWFGWAARCFRDVAGDTSFVTQQLQPALREIAERFAAGGVAGARLTDDGLIHQQHDAVPLTWMDAWLGVHVFTPRTGKPVEINALWHHLLALLESLGERTPVTSEAVATTFRRRYWSDSLGHLYDVIDGPFGDDGACRPNQLLAVSLHEALLDEATARAVLGTVTERLLTPYGLRTLAANDPSYRGVYDGDLEQRDLSYHQGTAWTWLLGPYGDAVWRLEPDRVARVRALLEPFEAHLDDAGLGQISQIFDGDPPHRARGCPAHAAAVGELLRLARRLEA